MENKKLINIRLDSNTLDQLESLKKETNMSATKLIENLIFLAYVETKEGREEFNNILRYMNNINH